MKQRNGASAPKAEVRKKEVRSFVAGKSLQIRKSADGKMTLEGYAIRFGQPANLGDFVEYVDAKALNRTLRENGDVILLRDHKQELLLARTTAGNLKLTVDDKGLRFSADLLDTETARTAYTDIKGHLLTGMSFGFFVIDDKWTQDSTGNLVRTLIDIELFEISATSFPAYQSTEVDARSVRSKLGSNIATRDDDDFDDDIDCDDTENEDDPRCDEDRCECRCQACSENRCQRCSDIRCADRRCDSRACFIQADPDRRAHNHEVEVLNLRLKLAQHRRPIQSK